MARRVGAPARQADAEGARMKERAAAKLPRKEWRTALANRLLQAWGLV